ncbi:MAG: T9SS type A sorting domain-containing protein [candidate division Zixibacteria bacterium]|nr:T9SS type A sorting domain-containing protein [candidate division Zixibacteria bacterium]
MISNSGSGTLFWRAEESISWLALSATDGAGNDTVSLQVDLASITTGDFQDIVVFHDTSANGGASDTLIVTLDYASGLPYILLSSDTVQVEMSAHSSGEVNVTVSNGGIGTLGWELTSLASWLSPITLSGSNNQEARLAVDAPTFGPGLYFGVALISDSAAFNSPETLIVAATFTPADTLGFGPASALPGDNIDLILSLSLRDPVSSITAPLVIDTAFFRFESLELMDSSALPFFTLSYTWDSASGALRIDYRPTDSLQLAELAPRASREFLKLTLRAADFEFTLPTTQFLSADSIIFGYPSGYSFEPILQHSEVRVGLITGVQPDDKPPLPEEFTLAQNYPNPFNLSTTISFFLPRTEEVELKIYNVLGRTIRTLLSGRAPAGWNTVQWDGRTGDNFDAPSGVYFYRVTAGDLTLSRKALLLK